VTDKDLKYFYEKLLKATGIPLKHFGVKKIIRMNKIKRLYGIEEHNKNI
jgi:hypothetical protein